MIPSYTYPIFQGEFWRAERLPTRHFPKQQKSYVNRFCMTSLGASIPKDLINMRTY
jgi:hypothetical protein